MCFYPVKERCCTSCDSCDGNLNQYKKADYDPYQYL